MNPKSPRRFMFSPTGKDANTGTLEAPFGSIQKAIDAAGTTNTKIVIADGVYRRYVDVKRGDNLLVFEAQHPGKAIVSGADIMTGWKESETPGVFEREWTQKWGLSTENGWWGSTPLNRRREMVYVNDARLVQRVDDKGGPVSPTELKAGRVFHQRRRIESAGSPAR